MLIVKESGQTLTRLTDEERAIIKESLTFNNPKYAQAKKFGRGRYTSIPPYLTYYSEFNSEDGISLRVPIGVDIAKILHKEPIPSLTRFTKNEVEYPPFNLELRDDQRKAFDGFMNYKRPSYPEPNHMGIIQLPTGKGKTILGLYFASVLKQKTLVLVHKDDLVVGWKKDIELCFGNIDVGLIKAKSRKVGEQITIATVQTLAKMDDKELGKYLKEFGLVIQDEVHHCAATTFNIIDRFSAYYKIGLSATPTRGDGLTHAFDIFFGGIVYRHKYIKEDKDILPVRVIVEKGRAKYRPFVTLNSNGVPNNQYFNLYDFKPEELPSKYCTIDSLPYEKRPIIPHHFTDDAVVTSRAFKIQVCSEILRHVKQGHSCLALFTQKEHINLYFNYLKRYLPENSIIKYYGDSKENSADLMEKAEKREALITLATLAKATEGTNVKAWEVLFLVSSMNNEKNVEQALGRIRRTNAGKINPVLVYDYIHPNVALMKSHFGTRNAVYKKLKCDIVADNSVLADSTGNMFKRGFK